jgi:hypothetical protein
MLNTGNNDREQNWLLLSPRVKRTQSDWRAGDLGCPRCVFKALLSATQASLKLYFVKMTRFVSLISVPNDNRKFVILTNVFIILTNLD